MARPKQPKMTKEIMEFIIENPYRMSWAAMGRKFHLDHATILYYVKKLRKAGFTMYNHTAYQAPSDALIEQIKKEKKYGA